MHDLRTATLLLRRWLMGANKMTEPIEPQRVQQTYARYGAAAISTIALWAIAAMFVVIGLIALAPSQPDQLGDSGLSIVSWFIAAALCVIASVIIDIRILSERSLRTLPFVYLAVLAMAVGVTQVGLHL